MTALDMATRLIAQWEGCRLAPYQDVAGHWTIGYGNTYLADGTQVHPDTPPLTQQEAMDLLEYMAASTFDDVTEMITVDIPQDCELAALTSFAYNEGVHALRESTMLRLYNDGNVQAAADEFPKWVYAGGHISRGLVNRRNAERAVFLGLITP